MDIWFVLMELVSVFGMAFILGGLAQKFRQSPIIGYIFAGVAARLLINDTTMISNLAEIGVSLLLFSIGLEFSFKQLKRMGKIAFGGGASQVSLTVGTVCLAGLFFMELPQAFTLGALVALSSTTIVLRVLVDKAQMESIHGRTSLGILLFQDIAIVPLVIMISLFVPRSSGPGLGTHLVHLAAAVSGLVLILYILLYHLVPKLLSSRFVFPNRELTVLFAVATGLGATWAAHTAGISPALGAFVAGMLIGESPFATQVRSDIGSLKILMVTLFFASVGMFIKPLWFITHIHLIFPLALAIFLLKAGIIFGITRFLGVDRRHALATGIVLGQIGEFSFVLASEAMDGGLLNQTSMDYIIAVTILLMLATPYMVTAALPLSDRLINLFFKKNRRLETDDIAFPPDENRKVLVVGLGPAGRRVVTTLKAQGMSPVVIDVNPQGRQFAQQEEVPIFLGDAASEEILHHAGLSRVCLGVVTVPDARIAVEIITHMKRLAPDLPIAARCRYNRHYQDLLQAGATLVVDEEILMGETLGKEITTCLSDDACTLLASRLAGKTTE
ncbi:cation:proton antiporter [uncultured Desulfobacter sp.]|uniref:cation:proton antiporter n=1 Tax=uncultured Desulfobacter sp. TaxID=240139 RepID=UPI002AAB0CB2|nr:cation:proton antiporter [uncultured Desulfobacter sp.]